MKYSFLIFSYGVVLLLLLVLLNLLGCSFLVSLVTASAFLIPIVLLHYALVQINPMLDKRSRLNIIYVGGACLLSAYLVVMLVNYYISDVMCSAYKMPELLLNPFLLMALIGIPSLLIYYVEKRFRRQFPYDTSITFVSNRQKITIDPAMLSFIESNDTEVYVHTSSGEIFRTYTRISEWERMLDERFIRVHRSYIVNMNFVQECNMQRLVIANRTIDVSRKYKDKVRLYLTRMKSDGNKGKMPIDETTS